MDRLYVTGGARLAGSVRVSGAKNSALKLMAASLLAPGKSVVRNVPRIRDCNVMAEMLEHFGVRVTLRDGVAELDATHVDVVEAPDELVRQMRASIVVLGPLLARCGRAQVSMPGGDEIGARPVDLHVRGLERMGATIRFEHGFLIAEADELRGAPITLDYPSVTATENLLFAAVRARGVIGDRQRRARAGDRRRRELPDRHGREDQRRRVQHDRDRGRRRAAAHRPHRGARPHRGRDVGGGGRRDAGRRDDRERPARAPGAVPLEAARYRDRRVGHPMPGSGSGSRSARAPWTS